MRSALEEPYRTCSETWPWHHFLVATNHEAELCDNTDALVADAAQCVALNAMILPWEGQQYSQTLAAHLVAQYVELGGSELVHLDRLPEQVCGTGEPRTSRPQMCR